MIKEQDGKLPVLLFSSTYFSQRCWIFLFLER